MAAIKIRDGVYSVGVLNPGMRIFDTIMRTEYGTSYNAYLVTGEKNVLIDTVHPDYFDEYFDNIKSVVDPAKIDYIIMNHNEPDHSGSLAKLLCAVPGLKVLSSPAGKLYLKNITNKENLSVEAVKDGQTLELGGGKTLKFVHAPFLHWPDSIFTILEKDKIAFTCDFLGCHFCEPRMFDSLVKHKKHYENAFREYFDAIFGPFKPYVQKGLAKLNNFDAELVLPSHGPILSKGVFLEKAKALYDEWSRPSQSAEKHVAILYCSAYGNTAVLAEKIKEGILDASHTTSVDIFDINENDIGKLKTIMNESDAFLLGSPTINKDAVPLVWELASCVDAVNCKGKAVSAFGSFGWSGEAVPALISRFKALKMNVYGDGLTCRFVPSEKELDDAFSFGKGFAATI